jgi:DNA-binding CsgD family transcriptional regulator
MLIQTEPESDAVTLFFEELPKEQAHQINYKEVVESLNYIYDSLFEPWTFVAVLDLDRLEILYANDNCLQLFGEGGKSQTSQYLPFAFLRPESQPLFKLVISQFQNMVQAVSPKRRKFIKTQWVGLRLKPLNGKPWVSFATLIPISARTDGTPNVVLMINQNISHLYNANAVWLRQSCTLVSQCNAYFHSRTGEVFNHDILSKRELEILKLIAQGFNSQRIASELAISVNTVSNHRKNMMVRVGVSDTTALLQIAQWCDLI